MYEKRSSEYQSYLIARNYFLLSLAKQFKKVSQISRVNAQKLSSKIMRTDFVKFVTSYNTIFTNIDSLINQYLLASHVNLDHK